MEVYMKCPKCGHIHTAYDYHENESSDRCEFFEVLNLGASSCHMWVGNSVDEQMFQCFACGAKYPLEDIFSQEYCSVENIEVYKERLYSGLYNYLSTGCCYFSDWDPDWSEQPALSRLMKMYPEDPDFEKLSHFYCLARQGSKKYLTKLEFAGKSLEATQILCPEVLRKVYLHDGVEVIGPDALANTVRLCDVFLPDTVQEICSKAFFNSGIRKIHMSDNITAVGAGAFENCFYLKNPWMPSNLKTIGPRAFYNCGELTKIMLPERVVTIGADAFANCPHLTIKCVKDSVAHRYAEENGIQYQFV